MSPLIGVSRENFEIQSAFPNEIHVFSFSSERLSARASAVEDSGIVADARMLIRCCALCACAMTARNLDGQDSERIAAKCWREMLVHADHEMPKSMKSCSLVNMIIDRDVWLGAAQLAAATRLASEGDASSEPDKQQDL